MSDALFAGLITCAGVLIVLIKMGATNVRRILHYHVVLDLGVTIGVAWFMYGTNTGIQTAMVAGLATSIALIGMRWIYGYEKLMKVYCESCHASYRVWRKKPGMIG